MRILDCVLLNNVGLFGSSNARTPAFAWTRYVSRVQSSEAVLSFELAPLADASEVFVGINPTGMLHVLDSRNSL